MMHVKGTHQDCEASVIKANRKHQIVLNMEVKRIEMEKKMRERYFCFEMSLVKARRLKIVNRQKSLGIYRPHTVDRKETRKGMEPTSFFFTQFVAMDSKVKLPPVFQKNRNDPGYLTKLSGNFKMLQVSKNMYNNKIIIDKEQTKRIHQRKMETMERGRSQSQTMSPMKKDSKKLDGKNVDSQKERERNELKHKEIYISSRSSSQNKHEKQLAAVNLMNKGEGQDEIKEIEQNNPHSNPDASGPVHSDSGENKLSLESSTEAAVQNALKFAPSEQTCIKCASPKAQNISKFTTFEKLHAWRDNLETYCFNPSSDYQALTRAKSATRYGRNIEVYNLIVRPQTAFAKLAIE